MAKDVNVIKLSFFVTHGETKSVCPCHACLDETLYLDLEWVIGDPVQ
jgi:hypothetical protein